MSGSTILGMLFSATISDLSTLFSGAPTISISQTTTTSTNNTRINPSVLSNYLHITPTGRVEFRYPLNTSTNKVRMSYVYTSPPISVSGSIGSGFTNWINQASLNVYETYIQHGTPLICDNSKTTTANFEGVSFSSLSSEKPYKNLHYAIDTDPNSYAELNPTSFGSTSAMVIKQNIYFHQLSNANERATITFTPPGEVWGGSIANGITFNLYNGDTKIADNSNVEIFDGDFFFLFSGSTYTITAQFTDVTEPFDRIEIIYNTGFSTSFLSSPLKIYNVFKSPIAPIVDKPYTTTTDLSTIVTITNYDEEAQYEWYKLKKIDDETNFTLIGDGEIEAISGTSIGTIDSFLIISYYCDRQEFTYTQLFIERTESALNINNILLSAEKNNHFTKLFWEAKFGNDDIESIQIQKSNNGYDYQTFEIIQNVAINKTLDYEALPINYYRIHATTKNHKSLYSNIVKIQYNANNHLTISPNPAINNISISNAKENNPYKILNINGQSIQSGKLDSSNCTIDISSLTPGIYFIKIGNEKFTFTKQ